MEIDFKHSSPYAKERLGLAEVALRASGKNLGDFIERVRTILGELQPSDTVAFHGINAEVWHDLLPRAEMAMHPKHGFNESIVAFEKRTGATAFLKRARAENLIAVLGPGDTPLAYMEGILKKSGQWWKLQSSDIVKTWVKNLPAKMVVIFLSHDHLSAEFYGDLSVIESVAVQAKALR